MPPRKVNQTTFGRKGDALQACFASLLDVPMADVPNFLAEPDYVAAIQAYLRPRDLAFVRLDFDDGAAPFAVDGVPCVVVGTSPLEGGIRQCCVGVTRVDEAGGMTVDVVHDPHPETAGFIDGAPLLWAGLLVSLRPSAARVDVVVPDDGYI